jgi:hypothetical protein
LGAKLRLFEAMKHRQHVNVLQMKGVMGTFADFTPKSKPNKAAFVRFFLSNCATGGEYIYLCENLKHPLFALVASQATA